MLPALQQLLILIPNEKPTVLYSKKAVCWFSDNKVLICCAEKIIIVTFTVITSPELTTRKDAFTTRVDETPCINLCLDSFSVARGLLNFTDSYENLSQGDRQRLSGDPSLTEDSIYHNPATSTLKRAVCSPVCLTLPSPQTLIAAVTHNHRVLVFTETLGGWEIALDCSEVIRELGTAQMSLPVTLGRDMTLTEYRQMIHKMCTVELAWSCVFSVGEESARQPFLLLFTGTKSGHVNIWRVSLPLDSRSDFTFLSSDSHISEVTALVWFSQHNNQGLLAVGYLNGSVRILSVSVNCSTSDTSVQLTEMFADLLADDLTISDLGWMTVNSNTQALVACKQFFLSLYSVSGDMVRLLEHYHLDITLPLTSISTFGSRGMANCQDGVLVSFQCHETSDGLKLEPSVSSLTCKPFSPDVPWLCGGVALSPSSGLCVSAHRGVSKSRIMETNRILMKQQVVILSVPFKLSEKILKELISSKDAACPGDVMIYLRLQIQHITHMSENLVDIVAFLSQLAEQDHLSCLQVCRDELLFLKYCSAWRAAYQKELQRVCSDLEEVTDKLLARHIETSFQRVSSSIVPAERLIVKSMLTWLETRSQLSPHAGCVFESSLTKDLAGLAGLDVTYPTCAICGSEFQITGSLEVQCTQKHSVKLCALTLEPCQELSSRRCGFCGQPAVSMAALSDVKLISAKHSCVLCGGTLGVQSLQPLSVS